MDKNVGAVERERERERERELLFNKTDGGKGITLVALIITIIVLLILAGVSLSFVFNGGILDKSQQAVNEYQNAANNESEILEYIDSTLEQKINEINSGSGAGGGTGDTPTVDSNGLADKDTTIKAKDDPNVQIVIPEGFAPVILQTDRTDSLPGENGAVKAIMPVEDWNKISAEQINKGIVVVDHAITYTGSVPDFNEYVWVPIADSSKFARVAWNGPYYDRGYHSIGPHPLSKEPTSYQYWEETSSKEYIDMVSSVSSNKGFYIGRYESSEKDHVAVRAESKRGQEPMLGLSQGASVSAAENSDLHSHLIYGIEWDSVLQWFLNSGATIGAETGGTKTITINEIQNDSRSWGNYNSSVGGAATNSGYKQPGGTNEYWKANNIYDLAGNVREWTQEMYSTGTDCVIRGGYYDVGGLSVPVANRDYRDVSSTNVYSIGYRVSFYI